MGIIPTGKVERGGSISHYSTEKEKEVQFDDRKKERDENTEIFEDKHMEKIEEE